MDARTTASLSPSPRIGIIVPRYGHSAVDRNRVKRQLRELIRLDVLPELPVMDVVLRIAPRAYQRTFQELREEVRKLRRQLRAPAHVARDPQTAAPDVTLPAVEPVRPPAP